MKVVHEIQDDTELGEIRQIIASVPTLSDYIDVKCDEKSGRFLVASKDLERGEWFLQESALVSWPHAKSLWTTNCTTGPATSQQQNMNIFTGTTTPAILSFYEQIFDHLPWKTWAKWQLDRSPDTQVGILALASCLCQIAEQLPDEQDRAQNKLSNDDADSGIHSVNKSSTHQQLSEKHLADALRPFERLCSIPESSVFQFHQTSSQEIFEELAKVSHMAPFNKFPTQIWDSKIKGPDLLQNLAERLSQNGIGLGQARGEQQRGLKGGDAATSAPTPSANTAGAAGETNDVEQQKHDDVLSKITSTTSTTTLTTTAHSQTNRKGVFVLLSLLNHDCDANVEVELDEEDVAQTTVNLKTNRVVKKGEKLTINYCPEMTDDSEKYTVCDRRKKLKHWHFECHCSRCEGEVLLKKEMSVVPAVEDELVKNQGRSAADNDNKSVGRCSAVAGSGGSPEVEEAVDQHVDSRPAEAAAAGGGDMGKEPHEEDDVDVGGETKSGSCSTKKRKVDQ
ncbi:unnamed protein product [Amoebophrya sp. A120]|nr:unnamed protein product [Amoebophrya sp. A120]|eukprot:GSA120T00008848001.1